MYLHTKKVQQNNCSKTKHINMKVLDRYVCFKADIIILINKMCYYKYLIHMALTIDTIRKFAIYDGKSTA